MDAQLFYADLEKKPSMLASLALDLKKENPWATQKLSPENDYLFLGMGSSHYASCALATRLRSHGIRANAELASNSLLPAISDNTVIIAISASGKSEETNFVVQELSRRHRVIALTNNVESPLAKMSSSAIAMNAGVEEGEVVCRTYTHTLALESALEDSILGRVSLLASHLEHSSLAMEKLLETLDLWLPRFRETMIGPQGSYFVAPAERFCNAQQSALMVREGPRKQAVGCETGDWSHVDVYLTKTIDYRMALFAGSIWETNLMKWCTERASTVVSVGAEIAGSTYALRYLGDDNPAVRYFTESFIAELLSADCWRNP
ncbi:MAG: SIS domain-containing protein [Actinomycetes bacterium]